MAIDNYLSICIKIFVKTEAIKGAGKFTSLAVPSLLVLLGIVPIRSRWAEFASPGHGSSSMLKLLGLPALLHPGVHWAEWALAPELRHTALAKRNCAAWMVTDGAPRIFASNRRADLHSDLDDGWGGDPVDDGPPGSPTIDGWPVTRAVPPRMTPSDPDWWIGSPYRSFKNFLECMNRDDLGNFKIERCIQCEQFDFESDMACGPWVDGLRQSTLFCNWP
eukprot:SAG31_NODE_6269_length_2094_cov_18.212030_2_plen_220_part_00